MKYAKPLCSYAFTSGVRYKIRDWEMRDMGEVICREAVDGGAARAFESDGIREPLVTHIGDIYKDTQGGHSREVAVFRVEGSRPYLWSVFSSDRVE